MLFSSFLSYSVVFLLVACQNSGSRESSKGLGILIKYPNASIQNWALPKNKLKK